MNHDAPTTLAPAPKEAPARRRVLLGLGLSAILIVTAGVLWQSQRAEEPRKFGAQLQGALDARLVSTLESDPAWVKTAMAPGWRPLCAAKVLGAEPAGVTAANDATTLYAWVSCDFIDPEDVEVDHPSGTSVPVVVHFGTPNRYDLPTDGAGYSDSLRALFPRSLHDLVIGDTDVRLDDAAVDRRVEELRRAARNATPPR